MSELPIALVEQGYMIATRDEFLHGRIEIAPYASATGMTPQQIAKAHVDELYALRQRVLHHAGSHVIYDPSSDGDGWLLVGEPDLIIAETEQMLADLA